MKSVALFLAVFVAAGAVQNAPAFHPSSDDTRAIEAKLSDLSARVDALRAKKADPALLADVDIYRRAAELILRFPEEFATPKFVADTLAALDTGIARTRELDSGSPSWPKRKGHVVRGYVSRVDGSVQPYALTIPQSYDGSTPMRLDIWQHGTNRTLNEVAFITQQQADRPVPADQDYIQLEPLGRTNVSYRWAGEADLFEALASVRERYAIDPHRIVLRGFSMGGASSWHLGLHHPGTWAAIEAGAGYTETKKYGKRESLPPHQEAMLHYYDAVDYSLNAFNTPTVGYGGEDDAQLQASVNIREQLVKEGFAFRQDGPLRWVTTDLRALFLVGPKTGHAWHPDSRAQSNVFIANVLRSADTPPSHVRFVTYTTRFNKAHWLTVDSLEETYKRAEVDATRSDDGKQYVVSTKNVDRVTFDGSGGTFTIDGQALKAAAPVPAPTAAAPVSGARPSRAAAATFEKHGGKWTLATAAPAGLQKVHGLQGPVDDAFVDAFLCVRPTGSPWHAVTGRWATTTLDEFSRNFAKWLRGDVRVKDDRAVSASDIADYNLILFGDPRSNSVIHQIVGRLPIRWTETEIVVGAQKFSASDHIPVLIYPNPLNPRRYVVINSGHTFGDADFRGTNAWLYPRLGDYAVLTADGTVALSGFFDEKWRLPSADGAWTPLWNGRDLDAWTTWMRQPEPSSEVPGLKRDANGKYLEPIGSGRDPLKVFTVQRDVDGRPAIRISGEVFGELRSRESFKDYHVRLQFKWGERKWPPRDAPETPRDSGLLYHVHAAPGVEGRTWARSIELQIQEHDVGDLYAIGSAIAVRAKVRAGTQPMTYEYDPNGEWTFFSQSQGAAGRCIKQPDAEKRSGAWNTVELVCFRDDCIHVVNGTVVMRLHGPMRIDTDVPTPVTSGPIILQSEGAEVFYRDIEIRPITAIPPEFAAK